jgi:hypothetical protein
MQKLINVTEETFEQLKRHAVTCYRKRHRTESEAAFKKLDRKLATIKLDDHELHCLFEEAHAIAFA